MIWIYKWSTYRFKCRIEMRKAHLAKPFIIYNIVPNFASLLFEKVLCHFPPFNDLAADDMRYSSLYLHISDHTRTEILYRALAVVPNLHAAIDEDEVQDELDEEESDDELLLKANAAHGAWPTN